MMIGFLNAKYVNVIVIIIINLLDWTILILLPKLTKDKLFLCKLKKNKYIYAVGI